MRRSQCRFRTGSRCPSSPRAGHVAAAFRGAGEVVLADAGGNHRSVAIAGDIAALASGADLMGTPFSVVLTRSGDVLRVETSGTPVAVARLGAVGSDVGVAIAAGRIFVARAGLPVVALDAAGPTRPRSVGTIDPSILASDGRIVWAADPTTGDLERIDASTLDVTGRTHVNDVVAMAADADGAYLARPGSAEISAVNAGLSLRHVAPLDPSTTAISVGGGTIWTAAFGVMRANNAETGQLVATIARSSPQLGRRVRRRIGVVVRRFRRSPPARTDPVDAGAAAGRTPSERRDRPQRRR